MNLPTLAEQVHADLAAGVPERVFDHLVQVLERPGDLRDRWTAQCWLPRIAERMPASAFGDARRQAALRVGVALPGPRSVIGRMAFPAIGGPASCFVNLRVTEIHGPDHRFPAELTPPAREAMARALDLARHLAGPAAGSRYEVALDVAGAPVGGESFGLALGLAVLSHVRRRPIDDGWVATGALRGPDGAVSAVEHVAEKLALHARSRPGARMLVPAAMELASPHAHLRPIASLGEAAALLGLSTWHDPVDAIGRVRRDFACGRWPEAAEGAEVLLGEDHLRDEERVDLLMILLAAQNHRGEQREAWRTAAVLRPLLDDRTLSPRMIAEGLAHLAMQAVDLLLPEAAEAVLRQADRLALPEEHEAMLHVRGTRALCAILRDDLPLALDLRRCNAEHGRRFPDERPRCLVDLADVLLRLGAAGEALGVLEEAQAALAESGNRRREYVQIAGAFLGLVEARARRALGQREAAVRCLAQVQEDPRGPGLQLALERALLSEDPLGQLLAIERDWSGHPQPGEKIFQALLLRVRVIAGDLGAISPLAAMFGTVEPDVAALCRRLPY